MANLRHRCTPVPQPSELWFGVVRAVGRGIAVLQGGPRRARGRGGLGFLFPIFIMVNASGSPTVKCFRFVCDNFTTFPFGKHIVRKFDSWTFWRYVRFQHPRQGLWETRKRGNCAALQFATRGLPVCRLPPRRPLAEKLSCPKTALGPV